MIFIILGFIIGAICGRKIIKAIGDNDLPSGIGILICGIIGIMGASIGLLIAIYAGVIWLWP